jgi:pyruvate dehydrogenase E2 component (dihydrolipoamide acetyltransferase)
MFGVEEFSAIINPPHSCIFAVGAGLEKPVVRDGALAVATVMTVTLAVDHRAVDGAVAALLLSRFKSFIEEPLSLLA